MLPCDGPSFSFATWNANGFLTAQSLPIARRRVKNRAFDRIIGDHDVVVLQEAHGQREPWNTYIRRLEKSHKIFYSSDLDSPNKAGVAIIIKSNIYKQAFGEEVIELILGRAITVKVTQKKGTLSLTSLHNFEPNETTQRKVAEHCAEEKRLAQNYEQGSSIRIIGGDFYFLARGELPVRISLNSLELRIKGNDTRATNLAKNKWHSLPANATEHHQPNHTKIGHNPNANENPDSNYLIAKRIDKKYSSILPWQANNLRIKTHTTVDITKAETACGSDHTSTATKITPPKQIPQDQRPIPH